MADIFGEEPATAELGGESQSTSTDELADIFGDGPSTVTSEADDGIAFADFGAGDGDATVVSMPSPHESPLEDDLDLDFDVDDDEEAFSSFIEASEGNEPVAPVTSQNLGDGLLDFISQEAPASAPTDLGTLYTVRLADDREIGPLDEAAVLNLLETNELVGGNRSLQITA